ncbi:hypothetical protein [Amphritea sp.]|uniref:hypothetical protein n=1 Tax=Amphritea sp. TaxID=1872502 RepID=UPI003D09F2CB
MNRYLIPVMSLLLLLPCSGNCAGLDGLMDMISGVISGDEIQQGEAQQSAQSEEHVEPGADFSGAFQPLVREDGSGLSVDTGQFMLVRVSSGIYALYSLNSEDRKDPGLWLGSVNGRLGMGLSYDF